MRLFSIILLLVGGLSFNLSAQCDVTGLAASDAGLGTMAVNWIATPGATKYQIQIKPTGGAWIVNDNSITSNSYTATGLVDDTEYQFRVRANCGSWGSYTGLIKHTLNEDTSGGGGGNCATATGLAAANITATSADLSWDDMSATDYRIQIRPVGGSYIVSSIISTFTYAATGLTPGTDYEYRVRTRCGTSWQVYSAFVPFTTPGGPPSGGLWTEASDQSHIYYDGDVLIGDPTISLPAGYNLYVEDGILTEKAKVALSSTASWSDYVFAEDYKLNTIEEVETFIKANKHLPHVPSAKEVKAEGIDVATMDATLLRQIEELWLHMIEMKKENEILKKQIKTLSNK